MRNQKTIRPLLSGFLLLLFSFGVTPRIFLHNWVARHKDQVAQVVRDGQDHLQRITFHCQTEDQVVESPFVGSSPAPIPVPPIIHQSIYSFQPVNWHSTHLVFSSLRGPPASC